MRRIVLAGYLCALMCGSFLCFGGIRPVKAYDAIYIRADGSIDPSTSPIQRNGNYYALTDNVIFANVSANGIVVERENIVFAGNGYKIQGTGAGLGGIGICVSGVNEVMLGELKIEGFSIGIFLNDSDRNAITRCSFSGNLFNVQANNSDFNYIERSNMTDAGLGTYDESAAVGLFSSSNNTVWLNRMMSGSGWGILADSSSNNTFFLNDIRAFNGAAICLESNCINNTITENNMTANTVCGVRMVSSFHNNIFNNNICENQEGIMLDDSMPTNIFTERITSDDVSVYQNNITDNGVGINFTASNGCSIFGNNVTNSHFGINLLSSSQNNASNNDISATECSIDLNNSINNTISENSIIGSNASAGMQIESFSDNNTITRNSILNCDIGIDIFLSKECHIFKNDLINNNNAMALSSSNNNVFYENKISDSSILGLSLNDSYNNSFFHNSFINDTWQVQSNNSTNTLDNGVEGNYWSDYNGDSNQDGIGDTPYVIDANNIDHYPLMGTFYSFNVSSLYYPHDLRFEEVIIISNSTIGNVDRWWADDVNSPVGFDWLLHITEVTGQEGTTGFCRIIFPNIMMNSSSYPVFFGYGDILPPTSSRILMTNGTHTTLYFTYVLPVSNSIIDVFPEYPSHLIPPLFFITTLFAVIVYRKRLTKG